jgi:hypothetical protein
MLGWKAGLILPRAVSEANGYSIKIKIEKAILCL